MMHSPLSRLDPIGFTHVQLVATARELAGLVASWQAANQEMLDVVNAAVTGPTDQAEKIRAVAAAIGPALVTWTQTLTASQEAAFARINAEFGAPLPIVQ